MISYIKGELTEIFEDSIVVECNGIGYNIYVPTTVFPEIVLGKNIIIYTHMIVREDGCNLFGFLTRDDVLFFQLLMLSSGVGPKVALKALSSFSSDDLKFAILSDDVDTIKSIPGIGPKTAQKIIIDLKNKLKVSDTFEKAINKEVNNASAKNNPIFVKNDAVEALTALGYSSKDALVAVNSVSDIDNKTAEDVIKEALKNLI